MTRTLTTTVTGVDEVLSHLNELGERVADLRPAFIQVAEDFHETESRLFSTHGGSAGEPWTGSKSGQPVTMEGRRAKLRRSLTVERANRSVQRITRNSVTLGSTHPLAHLHQRGTKARYARTYRGKPLAQPRYAGTLPRRVVVSVGEQDVQRWTGMIREYVTATGRRLGL